MRLAVLSDVHSNLEALDAVLAHASADRVAVLGDLIGYGADPQAVLDRLRGAGATLLAGNHDLALTERFDLDWFNDVAARAIEWTRDHVDGDAYAMLSSLEPILRDDGSVLVHGSVRDPAAEYLKDAGAAASSFAAEEFRIGFYGHTHVPFAYERDRDHAAVRGMALRDGDSLDLESGARYLLNPGSVGQPRDGDPRASYMIVEDGRATWHRVEYDVESAQRKIRDAGLPPMLADRLGAGR
jgi:predicted phosphodiesterase